MRRAVFALSAALVLAPAALAGTDRCTEPYGPALPKTAAGMTADDLRAAKADVEQFIKDSDTYQVCIGRVIDDPAEKMTPEQKTAAIKLINENQAEKVSIGNAFNDLVAAYNKAHPGG